MRLYLLLLLVFSFSCSPIPASQEMEQLEQTRDSLEKLFETFPDSIKLRPYLSGDTSLQQTVVLYDSEGLP